MNARGVNELQPHYPLDIGEAGDIHGLADAASTTPAARARPVAQPDDDSAAPPDQTFQHDPVLAMVAGILGTRLTTDNLAWRGDPVPVMRSLQKMLVAHSLTLPEARREPALGAIRAVELAVRWRLRWMQMRRSEAERHFLSPQDDHATAPPA